jgi:hypothetical protein
MRVQGGGGECFADADSDLLSDYGTIKNTNQKRRAESGCAASVGAGIRRTILGDCLSICIGQILSIAARSLFINQDRHIRMRVQGGEKALTMGIGTILSGKRILIMASGKSKAQAVKQLRAFACLVSSFSSTT